MRREKTTDLDRWENEGGSCCNPVRAESEISGDIRNGKKPLLVTSYRGGAGDCANVATLPVRICRIRRRRSFPLHLFTKGC
ncbi:hypothetical protein HG15A2_28750 [Adhaeretor mobilis]|uniref:Uncharacterized protein n=1 Tax=Adhaeretor mobilis TaxID=1930276 RepID=A0A517MXE9_9BACT|nr:hypothetical protein HG15A2_28750 [Adhaeretor mobilis]